MEESMASAAPVAAPVVCQASQTGKAALPSAREMAELEAQFLSMGFSRRASPQIANVIASQDASHFAAAASAAV